MFILSKHCVFALDGIIFLQIIVFKSCFYIFVLKYNQKHGKHINTSEITHTFRFILLNIFNFTLCHHTFVCLDLDVEHHPQKQWHHPDDKNYVSEIEFLSQHRSSNHHIISKVRCVGKQGNHWDARSLRFFIFFLKYPKINDLFAWSQLMSSVIFLWCFWAKWWNPLSIKELFWVILLKKSCSVSQGHPEKQVSTGHHHLARGCVSEITQCFKKVFFTHFALKMSPISLREYRIWRHVRDFVYMILYTMKVFTPQYSWVPMAREVSRSFFFKIYPRGTCPHALKFHLTQTYGT